MAELFKYLFISGILLIAASNLFMRQKNAPASGASQFKWPWETRNGYTPYGHILRLIGLGFWFASAVVAVFIRFG